MEEVEKKRRIKAINALHEYQAKGADFASEEVLSQTLRNESDRGYVILLVSFLEDALLERILKELPEGEKLRRPLVKGGPLRSIDHRLTMARALGTMSEGDVAIFDVFREMRNACAHSRQDISFKTPELIETFALMLSPDTREQMNGAPESTLKLSFEMCAGWMLALLHGRTHGQALDYVNETISEAIGEPIPPLMRIQPQAPEKPKG